MPPNWGLAFKQNASDKATDHYQLYSKVTEDAVDTADRTLLNHIS